MSAERKELGEKGFEALGVDPRFIGGLAERGILVPTEIQKRVIPRLLGGESLVFSSATGTGKTLAYLLPLLTELSAGAKAVGGGGAGKGPVLLVLAPTYELCAQIKGELDLLLRPSGSGGADAEGGKAGAEGGKAKAGSSLLLTGSGNPARQIDSLKRDKPAFIVGNPGRALLLARMGKLRFRELRCLVLDEGDRLTADELLGETGELIRAIRKDTAGPLRAVSASATLPAKNRERLIALLGEGLSFEEGDKTAVLRDFIEHWAIFSESRKKTGVLRSLIAALKPGKTLIFTCRGRQAEDIAAQLRYHGQAASALWGEMDKTERKRALADFRAGRVSCLVTSDLAARGLDIPGITHVIALDLEGGGEGYLHRAGRTARAGNRGVMVTIGDGEEMRRLERIEKSLGITVYPKEVYGGQVIAPVIV